MLSQISTPLNALRKLPLTRFETDSRKVKPGNIFVCKAGAHVDSHEFVAEARNRGAIGLIATRKIEAGIPCFVMPAHAMSVSLISQYYDYPQHKLFNIGVTGTNGKTTVAYGLQRLLNQHSRSAYTGTLGCEFDGYQGDLVNTTPDAITLLNLMHRMVQSNVDHHVMEVSSHALDQDRVSLINYDIAVFTNLGEDHLDYHGSRDDYLQTKLRLVDRLRPGGIAIINLDDPMAAAIADRCRDRASMITFSMKNPHADLYAANTKTSCQGSSFDMHYLGKVFPASTSLPFQFNVENYLAMIAVLIAMGAPPRQAASQVQQTPAVPGRCEVINLKNGTTVIVDYAHNCDALESLVSHVRDHTVGRVHTVIGVTGDRLRGAEAIGESCSRLSDHSYFTTDNPLGVEPRLIFEAMSRQADSSRLTIATNREQVIETAIARLCSNQASHDVLLVCGKGPETWQYTHADKSVSEPYIGDKAAVSRAVQKYGLA